MLPFGIFHVYVPCRSWTRRTCCLRLTPPRGARFQKHSQDPNCQFSRIPQATRPASFLLHGTRPVSPGPPRRRPSSGTVLQSISLVPLRQPLGVRHFLAFASPAPRRTPSTYWGLPISSRGGFFKLFLPPPPRRHSGDSPTKYSVLHSPSRPDRELLFDQIRGPGIRIPTACSGKRREPPAVGRGSHKSVPPPNRSFAGALSAEGGRRGSNPRPPEPQSGALTN